MEAPELRTGDEAGKPLARVLFVQAHNEFDSGARLAGSRPSRQGADGNGPRGMEPVPEGLHVGVAPDQGDGAPVGVEKVHWAGRLLGQTVAGRNEREVWQADLDVNAIAVRLDGDVMVTVNARGLFGLHCPLPSGREGVYGWGWPGGKRNSSGTVQGRRSRKVNEIVIFLRGIGPWVPRASPSRAVGTATPNARGCPCSTARRSKPRAGWSWSAIPGLTAPAKGRQRLLGPEHLGPRRIQMHVITHLQPACQPVF